MNTAHFDPNTMKGLIILACGYEIITGMIAILNWIILRGVSNSFKYLEGGKIFKHLTCDTMHSNVYPQKQPYIWFSISLKKKKGEIGLQFYTAIKNEVSQRCVVQESDVVFHKTFSGLSRVTAAMAAVQSAVLMLLCDCGACQVSVHGANPALAHRYCWMRGSVTMWFTWEKNLLIIQSLPPPYFPNCAESTNSWVLIDSAWDRTICIHSVFAFLQLISVV